MARLLALLAALTLVAAACDDGATEDDANPTGPTATTSDVAEPERPDEPVECDEPEGGTDEVSGDSGSDLLFIEDVEHEVREPGCIEAVTFRFEAPGGRAGHEVALADGPFQDTSGAEAEVDGVAFLKVTFLNGTTVDLSSAEPRETFEGGVRLDGGARLVTDIVLVSDFEGVSEWVVGLTAEYPFTVEATGGTFVVTFEEA